MNAINSLFDFDTVGAIIVVTPRQDLDEVTFEEQAEKEIAEVFDRLGIEKSKHAVVDCKSVDRCCSSAIAFFIRLAKRMRRNGGRLAFCNLSTHMRSVFDVLRLDTLWESCGSRDEAIAEVEEASAQ